ncbi:hypothetical protein Tco_0060797 [Tanacetum coccineum]
MSEQLARELEEEFAQENQRLREQAARDAEIARLHTEGELKMMIDELDRSNEVIAKHLKEYAEAEDVLSLKDKMELITKLAKYQKDLAQIKKYQAQQSKLASKTDKRKFYTSVLRSHAGWKTKDFKGMTFEQIEETFIPVWERIQDFVPMDSKLESSKQQFESNKDVKETESDDHDKIINLQQCVVLVRQESSVDITPLVVKAPIYDWKIFNDKLREVYQIFRVCQAPKAYPYFEVMLKEFDRDDMVTLWKLFKDRFEEELPKSDLEKCLFWPLKVMFEPVASDGLWQFKTPIKSWRLYKSCRVHYLIMEGMIIYMLDDVEYPLPKTTLQKMLDHKCEAEESITNFALMAYTSHGSSSSLSYQIGLESLGARIVVHEKNEVVYEEDIAFLKYDVQVKDISIKDLKNKLEEALKEKDDLKLNLEKFEDSSKNLIKLRNSQISAKDKVGLGYDSQMNKSEVVHSVFNSRESDVDNSPVNDIFKIGEGFHAVLPAYTENYMPSRPDLSFAGLDDSVYKTKVSETKTSISKTSKDIVEKPKPIRPSAHIIEDKDTDSDN